MRTIVLLALLLWGFTANAQIVKPQPITISDSTGVVATRNDNGTWNTQYPNKALEALYQHCIGIETDKSALYQSLAKAYAVLRWIEPSGEVIDQEKFDAAVKDLQ